MGLCFPRRQYGVSLLGMSSAQLRPIPFAIPFDIRPRTGNSADAANLPSQSRQLSSSQAARQATCESTVSHEQHAQEADTSALDQLQIQDQASYNGQQRTAKQRLEFLSPPETPDTVRTSTHAGVADGSMTSNDAPETSQDKPAASQSPTDAATLSELQASASGREATPMTAQVDAGEEFQPNLAGEEQEVAGLTGTAETPPTHAKVASGSDNTVDPSRVRMLASDGPSIQQPTSLPASVDAPLSEGSCMAISAEVVANAATSAIETTEPHPEPISMSVVETDSPTGAASADSSTQAAPDQNSQSAPESTAISMLAAAAGTGALSGPVHGVDDGAQENLGAAVVRSAMQGALCADAQAEEARVVTHRASNAAQNHESSSTAEAEASQAGKCLSGSFPSPELIGTQSLHSQKSGQALRLDDGQGASHAAPQNPDTAISTALALEQAPEERRSEDNRGTAASAFKAAPSPELVPQLSTTPTVEVQRTIESEVEATGAHAILPAVVEELTEAATPLLHQPPAERPTNTAQPFSLPVPPPVPQFKRQHFVSSPKAAVPKSPVPTALTAAFAPGGPPSSSVEEQLPVAGPEAPAEAQILTGNGDGASVPESHATDTDLLALAEEVRRLEQEVAAAHGAAGEACASADAARADARSARADAEEWREREADARSEVRSLFSVMLMPIGCSACADHAP